MSFLILQLQTPGPKNKLTNSTDPTQDPEINTYGDEFEDDIDDPTIKEQPVPKPETTATPKPTADTKWKGEGYTNMEPNAKKSHDDFSKYWDKKVDESTKMTPVSTSVME